MTVPILTTKLFIPPPRPGLVSRPRFLKRLNMGLQRTSGVTLISAPAGFGKTTLVSEWISTFTHSPRPEEKGSGVRAAWLSLSETDSDPFRFLIYVIAALQTIESRLGERMLEVLHTSSPPPMDALLTSLLNEIALFSDRILLILDDYHVIDSQAVTEALCFLVEHQPPHLHLVIASREDPPLPLARLRARDQLLELRAAELRFTPAEAAEFLNRVMGLDLSAAEMDLLENRTEGWIAGLQLAALALQATPEAATQADNTEFLRSFTGSHRFVLDYMLEEVLRKQSENIQNFLLGTCILDRLCGSLCEAVFQSPFGSGQATLEALEHSNLFVVPLDNERQWYRYHQLFRDLLRQRSRTSQTPAMISGYHVRASRWYEENGYMAEAFQHAIAAKDFAQAANVAERAWQGMDGTFQPAVWLGWVKQLPEEVICVRPVLCTQYAWALMDTGKIEACKLHLRDAERCLTNSPDEMIVVEHGQFESLPAMIAMARSYIAQLQGDAASTVKYAELALQLIPTEDPFRRAQATVMLEFSHWTSGNVEAARHAMEDWMTSMQQAGQILFVVASAFAVADLFVAQGRLHKAVQTYQQSLQLAQEYGPEAQSITAHHHLGLALIYRELQDEKTAATHLQQARELDSEGNLVYATFLGGDGDFDPASAIAVDADANAYIAGYGSSTEYPKPWMVLSGMFGAKLDADGNLVYRTFLGSETNATGIAVDSGGAAYLTSPTEVIKLNGSGEIEFDAPITLDGAVGFNTGIALDETGASPEIYVAGTADDGSALHPFVVKLNQEPAQIATQVLTQTVSTVSGIALGSGKVYLAGTLPREGQDDSYLARLSTAGALEHFTALDVTGANQTYAVAADPDGHVFLTGWTEMESLSDQSGLAKPGMYAFVAQLDAQGNLIHSINFGGRMKPVCQFWWCTMQPFGAIGLGIAVDKHEQIYVTGWEFDGYLGELYYGAEDAFAVRFSMPQAQSVTIDYTYDPLYRLTNATYSGDMTSTIGYAYDGVGNRLTQNIDGAVTNYGYDNANRLTSVNGVTYAWDENGNLRSDGINTYGYDQANHLTSVNGQTTFAYNGLGDRVRQTVSDMPITYVNDYAAGLTQVLSDGTHNYLYGAGRIAQQPTNQPSNFQYFGSDGLGSVRQMYDPGGVVLANNRYDPYGNVLSATGAGSVYGFTGEQADATGLVYLRARYLDPTQGRFTQADTVMPNPLSTQDGNRYAYVHNNPLIYTDSSGHDLVIVGGGAGANPADWEGWIRAYKKWGGGDRGDQIWEQFYQGWVKSQDRKAYLAQYEIRFMDWSGLGTDPDTAARTADLNEISASLDRQLQGVNDIVLLGHSRGGKVIEWYLGAYEHKTSTVKAAILIEGSTNVFNEFGGTLAGRNTWYCTLNGSKTPDIPFLTLRRSEAQIVTVNNWAFPVGGGISGAENFQTFAINDGGKNQSDLASPHGIKNYLAWPVMSYLRGESIPETGGYWWTHWTEGYVWLPF